MLPPSPEGEYGKSEERAEYFSAVRHGLCEWVTCFRWWWGEVACKDWPYLQTLRTLILLSLSEASLNAPNRIALHGRYCGRGRHVSSRAGKSSAWVTNGFPCPLQCDELELATASHRSFQSIQFLGGIIIYVASYLFAV